MALAGLRFADINTNGQYHGLPIDFGLPAGDDWSFTVGGGTDHRIARGSGQFLWLLRGGTLYEQIAFATGGPDDDWSIGRGSDPRLFASSQ